MCLAGNFEVRLRFTEAFKITVLSRCVSFKVGIVFTVSMKVVKWFFTGTPKALFNVDSFGVVIFFAANVKATLFSIAVIKIILFCNVTSSLKTFAFSLLF